MDCSIPPCGACSSAVERRTVAPDDVGSNPTRHPKSFPTASTARDFFSQIVVWAQNGGTGVSPDSPSQFLTYRLAELLEHEDILVRADLFQELRPHRHADLAQMRFAQQKHGHSRRSDSSANRERNPVFQDHALIRQLQRVQLVRELQLLLQRRLRHADAHGTEFVAALGHWVPDWNVGLQPERKDALFPGSCRWPSR